MHCYSCHCPVTVVVMVVATTTATAARILKKINFCPIHYVGIEVMCLTDGHMVRIHAYGKKA